MRRRQRGLSRGTRELRGDSGPAHLAELARVGACMVSEWRLDLAGESPYLVLNRIKVYNFKAVKMKDSNLFKYGPPRLGSHLAPRPTRS